ncbi:ABC transporter permease [Haloechinothrix salitolerans]|uniref:ABC transporter permease n=1 Tax=Haloechinothrix salitolerans TaxID=926830 RepID=A0ABW2BVZ3_9PSEU
MTALAGTGQLTRLALRRDRFLLPAWLLVLSVLPAGVANAYEQLYPTAAMREPLAATVGANPALAVLLGPAFDLSTPGGFTAWRLLGFHAVIAGLMVIFTVTRHTRAEEETARHELLASGVIGRYAPLTAAVLVATGASALAGLLATTLLLATGLAAAGALAYGAALTGSGLVFTGVAAIAAQLVAFARTSNGIATSVLGASFLLRGLGDASDEASWLSWLSPIGWAQRLRPFADERWWVLALSVVASLVTLAVGYLLLGRRDAGAGFLPERLGRAHATPSLRGPFALAWRLHRGSLIGWSIGVAISGAAFGAIALGIGDLIGDNPTMREMFVRMGGSAMVIDAFLAQIAEMFGMIGAFYGVQAALRARGEEVVTRVEPLLATAVTRLRFMTSHLVFALVGAAIVLAAAGLGAGIAHGLRAGDVAGNASAMIGATLVHFPAIWLVVGVAAVLYGFTPRWTSSAWAVAAVVVVLALFGPVLNLAPLLIDVSPFSHVPRLPAVDVEVAPLAWLTVLAAALLAAGLAAFRRRDIG